MISVRYAKENDIKKIQNLDNRILGSKVRFKIIKNCVKQRKCVAAFNSQNVVGYLIFSKIYFNQDFIELLIVDDNYRRKGIGKKLITYYENKLKSEKVFTSTNRSNKIMHQFMKTTGYVRSGIIHNLDEDDPEIIYFKRIKRKK